MRGYHEQSSPDLIHRGVNTAADGTAVLQLVLPYYCSQPAAVAAADADAAADAAAALILLRLEITALELATYHHGPTNRRHNPFNHMTCLVPG
jgi:hypothetical protein